MSKERLEEIIENLPYSIRYEGNVETLIKYTREQAERVRELEEKFKERENELIRILTNRYKYITQLENTEIILSGKIKRYREALEFYANEDNWVYGKAQHIVRGEKARKALEGEGND